MASEIRIPEGNTREHEECTNAKHVQMIRSEKAAGREVPQVGLSISAFAAANAAADGREIITREDTERAKNFCYQQASITQRNGRKSTARTFAFSWGKGKYL